MTKLKWQRNSSEISQHLMWVSEYHDDVIQWKHFQQYWPFVRGIHRSPVNCPRKGQWRGALLFSLICAWINAWVNNDDLRRHRAHYDFIVMLLVKLGQYHDPWCPGCFCRQTRCVWCHIDKCLAPLKRISASCAVLDFIENKNNRKPVKS